MHFTITNKEMVFEDENYITTMYVGEKGTGHEKGDPRLRCPLSIFVRVKDNDTSTNVRANMYWDAISVRSKFIFTGGSLVEFIKSQGHDYEEFQTYWNFVKRLATNIFSEDDISDFQKTIKASTV